METEMNYAKPDANTVVQEEKETPVTITPEGKAFLISTSRWANFIAIIGFILIGFMLIVSLSLFILTPLAAEYQDFQAIPFPLYFLGIIYLIYTVIFFFPYYYLYTFAKKVRKGLTEGNQSTFDFGLKNMRSFARFVGIVMIIGLSLSLLVIPIVIFSFGMIRALSGGAAM